MPGRRRRTRRYRCPEGKCARKARQANTEPPNRRTLPPDRASTTSASRYISSPRFQHDRPLSAAGRHLPVLRAMDRLLHPGQEYALPIRPPTTTIKRTALPKPLVINRVLSADEQRLAKATIWLTPSESSTPALLDIITCPMMTLTHPVRLVAPAEFSLRITDDYELADGSFERRPSRAEARWRFATQ